MAAAGQAETGTTNTQISTGVVGGGTGPLTVQNQHASTISDLSAASSKSGVSVALVPTPSGAANPATGITTANSGSTTATGLTASNDIDHTAAAAVVVGAGSQAPVNITSRSSVAVQDQGASGTQSGQAWAVAAGAAGSPSGVTTPSVAGASPASAAVSTTGIRSQNNLSNAAQSIVTSSGGAGITAPISIAPTQVASVNAQGMAIAASAAACSGDACPTSGSAGSGGTQAASGAADARGLVAQNVVNTQANVAVHVAGQNFAPIKVIVDSITQIFNLGLASATSGDTTAAGGQGAGSVTTGQTASSGSAQATGAVVQNTVNLRSSAAVRVAGDNYSPIDIVLNLASRLVNWGAGVAASGDAQSSAGPGGGASATSGGAGATGLQVMNLVNMWADASVDIQGNNYALIVIKINFMTNIDNRGLAMASSGNVAAGSAGGRAGAASNSQPSTRMGGGTSASGGSSSQTNVARGGDAVTIGSTVDTSITSTQIASANGSKPITSAAITRMLRNLPAGDWNPFTDQILPQTVTPTVQPWAASSSGNSTAVGLHSGTGQLNTQIAACSDPFVRCTAVNDAALLVATGDSPTNPTTHDPGNPDNPNAPGPGGTHSQADFAGINATPTPIPTRVGSNAGNTQHQTGGHGSSARRTQIQIDSHTAAGDLLATGHVVLVDLWDQWPGRRLPPMPNQLTSKPITSTVNASLGMWPGAEELPLPDLDDASQQRTVSASGGELRRAASTDLAADPDTGPTGVLAVVNVNPLSWPGFEPLPQPFQALPSVAVAGEQSQPADEVVDDVGVSTVDVGPMAILAAAVGAVGGTRRGRGLVIGLGAMVRRLLTLRPWPVGTGRRLLLARQAARGLALLRLTLGIFRLW